jgi:hypothetical protein
MTAPAARCPALQISSRSSRTGDRDPGRRELDRWRVALLTVDPGNIARPRK